MRGPQVTFIGKRRQGRIIQAVSANRTWHGRRGPAHLTINKVLQPTLDGASIAFTATLFYERVAGYASTVVEAIEKLETWYRERTMQYDPRHHSRNVDGDGRRRRRNPRGNSDQASQAPASKTKRKRAPRASTRGRKAEQ